MTTERALAIISEPENGNYANALSPLEVREQVNTIQHIMKDVMQDKVHYGVIPGCGDKPALLKPGAEKLVLTFKLAPDVDILEKVCTPDEIKYVLRVPIKNASGRFLGSGVGSCSSKEEKHSWREAVCDEEWDEAAPEMRRLKYKRAGKDVLKVKQLRRNPSDLENTVLKIAKKRAMVDAILTVTAASDIFTQDIEEMGEEIREAKATVKPEPKMTTRKLKPEESKIHPQNEGDAVPASVTDSSVDQGNEGGPDESMEVVTLKAYTKERNDKGGKLNRGLLLTFPDGSEDWWQCYDQSSMDLASKGKGKRFTARLEDKDGFKLCHELTEVD